jgi:hypothetical protein
MTKFIDPSWIKSSEYPADFLPAGSIAIDQASEDGTCTVKGFYDPKTGETHIQEATYSPGEPCRHPGCLSHVTHPCEGCGRIAGQEIKP